MTPDELTTFLLAHPPFDTLETAACEEVARSARITTFQRRELIADGFKTPIDGLYVVIAGRVGLWTVPDSFAHEAQETVPPGGVFGYSGMLTGRAVGPMATALTSATIAWLPAEEVAGTFSSQSGARFLAERIAFSTKQPVTDPRFGIVDELIMREPVTVLPRDSVGEAARRMSEVDVPYAAVRLPDGTHGMITDAILRRAIPAHKRLTDIAVERVMQYPAPTVSAGESAATALIEMLDRNHPFLLVLDRSGVVQGAVATTDFVVSNASADVALRQQITLAKDEHEFSERCRRLPHMAADLLGRGFEATKVAAVYTATIDAAVRRALELSFDGHPELDPDAFTFLALGSIGRGEAVLSSDIDSAVTFTADLDPAVRARYRAVFKEANGLLANGGLGVDAHGASAARKPFARTGPEWRASGLRWLADPGEDDGVIMISLLVDARPIHGDPGLPEVRRLVGEIRRHPRTLRLLLTESLARRARVRSLRDALRGRAGTFDIKNHALMPISNIARWAALLVSSTTLSTTGRLQDAAGSAMVPARSASGLIEIFETLQRVRLRYQLQQLERGSAASDIIAIARLSPIDRRVITQAVKEIRAAQDRMASTAGSLGIDRWITPADR